VQAGLLGDEGEAEARPRGPGARPAGEAGQHAFALGRRDPRAVVVHDEPDAALAVVDPDGDLPASPVPGGVLEQVVGDRPQPRLDSAHAGRRRAGVVELDSEAGVATAGGGDRGIGDVREVDPGGLAAGARVPARERLQAPEQAG